MGAIRTSDEAGQTTPPAGITTLYVDATTLPVLRSVDDAGNDAQISPIAAASAVGQLPTAATRTYITGSGVTTPAVKLKVGTIYRCRFGMTKTAAGTATSTIDVAVGTSGTTADAARCSFTKPAGTAVADEAWVEIEVVVKAIGVSGQIVASCMIQHNLSTTGHMAQQSFVATNTSGTFDTTTANLKIGVCITTGASDVITISQCQSEICND